jgi:protein-L-isoaspartate(D-aspartate) O-methyltransferase
MHQAKLQMLDAIERDWRHVRNIMGRSSPDERVLTAMAEVPREEFVPLNMRPMAYENRALPIEDGQTISQPFIVALMTDLLVPEPDDVILEIGTGSGYQAAVLSRLVRKVYSIEVIADLAERAVRRFEHLGYDNIEVRVGDGYEGWVEHSPFDGILVTAAAPHVPPPLIDQLKERARLIVPVGLFGVGQDLLMLEKGASGEILSRNVLGVAFVPLTGGYGKKKQG